VVGSIGPHGSFEIQGSAELLFTHLVSDQKLGPEQIKRMRKLLAGKGKKGET
jgi:hypothetical protein